VSASPQTPPPEPSGSDDATVNASPQTPPPEPSGDGFYAFVGFWLLMCAGYILFCWVLIVIATLLITPWVSLLHGGLSTHSAFYWAVSPRPWSLALRGGVCAAVMLALIFNPSGWIQRTRAQLVRDSSSGESAKSAADTDARARSETHPQAKSEETQGDTEDRAHAETQSVESNLRVLALTTGSFLVLLVALIGIFAGTDMQAAHDHLHGAAQCFSVGLQQPGHSARGQLRAWDALYFTTGNLTTAGTGLIAPLSTSCRAITTVQMAIGTTVILLGIGGLVTRLLQYPLFASGQRSRHP
jgi:hypothetical protein